MGRAQREKGCRGERLWRDQLKLLGCTEAQRGARNGVGGGHDVMFGIPGTRCECKFVERLNVRKALKQATEDAKPGEVPYVASKVSREDWLVTLRASDLMAMAQCLAAIEGKPIYPRSSNADGDSDDE